MADTVEQYRAQLVAQAEDAVTRLTGKVAKLGQQHAAAQAALATAEDDLVRAATADLDFVKPTSHARVGL